ncbi:MAG: T9SS C-terminal target domain-containing protein [Ignavibacteriales bacterium]|nr:MAG: T9SS C-terminal target domain-containing protein [Ignavibacteriales bacterium]
MYYITGTGDSLIFSRTLPGDWIYTVNHMPSIDGNVSHEIITGTKNGRILCLSGGTLAIPVELISFNGYASEGSVFLQWSTSTETNNNGFEIERKSSLQGTSGNWEKVGFVRGAGTTTRVQSYSFIDEKIKSGKYKYRLKQLDYDGSFEYTSEVEITIGTPESYSLEQNFPNPFNPVTTIRFSIPYDTNVKLSIFNILAEEVAVLVNDHLESGFHEVQWNGADRNNKVLPTGAYFYRIDAGDFVEVKKMMFIK